MKRKIAVILTAVLCLSALSPFASAANSPVVDGKSIIVIKEGQDLVLKNVMVVPETGAVIVTEEMDKVMDGKSLTAIKDGQDLVLKNVMAVPETGAVTVTEEMDKVMDGRSLTAIKDGQDLVLKNVTVVPETGFVIVTEEVDKQDAGVVRDFHLPQNTSCSYSSGQRMSFSGFGMCMTEYLRLFK